MSGQQAQRVRRNASSPATTKQGPMRATVPVALMRQNASPPRSGSDKKNGFSDSPRIDATKITNRISPEKIASTTFKAERSQALKVSSPVAHIRRTASLDTLYQAPSHDATCNYSYCGRLLMDRATQTPEEWNEFRKIPKKTSDSLELTFLRQRLQRSNQTGRSQQRYSPVHVVDNASATSPSSSCGHQLPFAMAKAAPIPIPHIPKPLVPRMRNSVEGLNQEIERLVLKSISSAEGETQRVQEPTPDGHRAPIARLLRATTSVNTQTPCDNTYSGRAVRSLSISPLVPLIPGNMDVSRPPSTEGRKSASPELDVSTKLGTSPQINNFLAREPPDGCEKIKIVEEPRKVSASTDGCLRPTMNFVLMPSQSSAFYPLYKTCLPSSATEKPPRSPLNERLQ